MFTLDHLKFLDSFQFLDDALHTVVENFEKSGQEFKIFNSVYKKHENTQHLLKSKVVFLHNFLGDINKLNISHLPSKDEIFNHLNNSSISTEEYRHTEVIYKAFNCRTLGNYLELY